MNVQRNQESSTWSCDLCCNAFEGGIATIIDSARICNTCIRQLFEAAIKSEADYPPRWGGQTLDIWDFRHAVDTIFLARYERKVDEWTCPPKERIYCRHTDPPKRPHGCGRFLGRRTEGRHCRQCSCCQWYSCLRCLECFSTSDIQGREAEIAHHCDPSVEQELRKRAFDGLKRGKDYQDCPNPKCERRVELSDGCNCMLCPSCRTEFCYVCGRKASEGSGHWRPGSKCPKWNQPGAKNATFYDSDNSSASASEDDELNMQLELLRPWERQVAAGDGGPSRERRGLVNRMLGGLGLKQRNHIYASHQGVLSAAMSAAEPVGPRPDDVDRQRVQARSGDERAFQPSEGPYSPSRSLTDESVVDSETKSNSPLIKTPQASAKMQNYVETWLNNVDVAGDDPETAGDSSSAPVHCQECTLPYMTCICKRGPHIRNRNHTGEDDLGQQRHSRGSSRRDFCYACDRPESRCRCEARRRRRESYFSPTYHMFLPRRPQSRERDTSGKGGRGKNESAPTSAPKERRRRSDSECGCRNCRKSK